MLTLPGEVLLSAVKLWYIARPSVCDVGVIDVRNVFTFFYPCRDFFYVF